ncbi:MAG TPA: esterase-like activity of phytase family protein, partial [Thermomicrobiales bacterium]|nr:esterase-like activity of phytase family protein [Thermomicrobiales bacterium]
MAGWWTRVRTTGNRQAGALLLLLALIAAACSGPDDARSPTPTATSSAVVSPTVAAPAPETSTQVATQPGSATPTATTAPVVATPSPTAAPEGAVCDTGVELLAVSDALDKVTYENQEVGGLSALAWSGEGSTYDTLSDRGGRVYRLDFPAPGDPSLAATIQLLDEDGNPDTDIDGEGLAILPNGDLLVSSEAGPSIREYTPDGALVAELPVPERFLNAPAGRATQNLTFESLALSPSGQRLFTAVEDRLEGDGRTDEGNSRIRVLRYDLIDGAFQPAAEYVYLTEPDQAVSEMVAISDTELLVLERSLSLFMGFTARVFHADLDGADDVTAVESLEDADAQPATKELLVDIADCPSGDAAVIDGFNPLLENFENMTLGPPQPDGRSTLIVGSDDNYQSLQTTRFLIFAIDADRLPPSS